MAESVYGEGALYTAAESAGRLRDYEKVIYGEKGFITNTNLSISGGGEKTSFLEVLPIMRKMELLKGQELPNNRLG